MPVENAAIIETICMDLEIAQPGNISYQDFLNYLTAWCNGLINSDFNKLIQLLYRLDISESKLKALLARPNSSAGELIAALIVERELQKIESRKAYKENPNIPEDEKW